MMLNQFMTVMMMVMSFNLNHVTSFHWEEDRRVRRRERKMDKEGKTREEERRDEFSISIILSAWATFSNLFLVKKLFF